MRNLPGLCLTGIILLSCQTSEVEDAPDHVDMPDVQSTFKSGGVQKMQEALKEKGYEVDATGTFDEPTKDALISFQKGEGLAETGLPDRETVRRLGIDPNELYPEIEMKDSDPNEQPRD